MNFLECGVRSRPFILYIRLSQILLPAAHKVPRNSKNSSLVALCIGNMYANMEVARLKTWCHHPGINLTRSLHGVVSGAPSIGSYGQEDVTARADQGTLLSLLKRIKEHFNSQMAFKKSMQLQGRWCILIHFSSFLNTFQNCFSEDVMNWLPLERGSQDKGSCQISSSYFRASLSRLLESAELNPTWMIIDHIDATKVVMVT